MDSIRVSKVEGVLCNRSSHTGVGTVHLTAHHLIFHYDSESDEEMWVPYPLMSLVTRMSQTLQGHSPINFNLRTFESFSLSFGREQDAMDVFESVKELTVANSVNQLYAFYYQPSPPFQAKDGWTLYSPREEFGRMGVGSRTKAWRFTDVNKDYTFCSTYPARIAVPTKISDATLQYASKYRSKSRIPALTYLHWANFGSITRSSQPMVGITQSRSIQDEKLIEAVFQSHFSPESRASAGPVYGATATNLIIDARPTTNAVANTAKGAGTENMDHYKDAKKAYMGIDNIHTMRDSLAKVVDALREADMLASSIRSDLATDVPSLSVLDRQALRRSNWLRHISAILEGSVLIARNVHVNSSHVLIHCSDGWDRTAQLSSISQICLDPFYRTIRGFEILVEKDWVSFGHKFLDRCGHLSSEKFFVAPVETAAGGGSADAAQAFLASMQNRFASQNHVKETSPVFHQFLESVRQIQRQFPERFEFNERFLRQLYYHLYSCQFGTFLYNCERERRFGEGGKAPSSKTACVWDFLNSPDEMEQNTNPLYDKSLDDPKSREPKADMGVLLPKPRDVRFWHELYGRTDEEMNGRAVTAQVQQGIEVLGLVETADEDPMLARAGTPSSVPLPPSPATSPPPTTPARASRSAIGELQASLATSPRELSVSLPSMSGRGDDFASELTTTPSAHILRSAETPTRRSTLAVPSQSSSTNRPLQQVNTSGDFLGNSGVRSMWGKFSSNASAAFSVVQDTYAGVAKDFRGLSVGPDADANGRTAELRSREDLDAWGEERASGGRTGPQPSYTIGASSNPWASVKARSPTASAAFDNPWSSVRASSPRSNGPASDLFGPPSPGFPIDPTVVDPALVRTPSRSPSLAPSLPPAPQIAPAPASSSAPNNIPPPQATSPSVPPDKSNSDPLGVL